ncbi:Probable polygalacturonase At3g15720 [Linum perenne]
MAVLVLFISLLVSFLAAQPCLSYRPIRDYDDARRYIDGFLDYVAAARSHNHGTFGYVRDQQQAGTFNVLDYGAVGDGRTDSTNAFMKAWRDFCGATGQPTLVIPSGNVFMLKPLTFEGPCRSPKLLVKLQGTLVAPGNVNAWGTNEGSWIQFAYVGGLTVNGGGKLDGQGQIWWDHCNYDRNCKRPTALSFHSCDNLNLNSLHHVNSPRNHISINSCKAAEIFNLMITAPDESPNTDGIDIAASSNINIHDSFMGTGDDCIAINGFSSHINITRVMCGPGHGISIGSLGKNGVFETVEDVHVQDCTFKGTTNGARIKTWKGGKGYVRRVSFEDITFVNAENPIIIDQEYFSEGSPPSNNYVEISDVTYTGVVGTSKDERAVYFNCVGGSGCKDIKVENVEIRSAVEGKLPIAVCNNAHGVSLGDRSPKISCLIP